ncbi:RNA polymerase, sigma-24 subunit, RpoE [Verrucomicrobium sp. GAS474]|uniref:sigma-70 family RNA polymerase sigma factor n=1 Tax=Verrucomicrobium sp. GAS474 TaxID=1882831 RepID=UPI00087B5D45|nr:sigma-70 family RNA polymerase sigma factor [Verrucomicrobium sp. GAS474]SDT91104.1 RNA polymerase, sigma-24 subunit, RpoE [Verrucomicrobium sp. GAS474]
MEGGIEISGERFEERFLPHCDAAHNLARWLMRNDRDAEDAVQESYLRAYKAFARFRGGDPRACKAWFLTIVRHVCYTSLRKRHRHDAEEPFDEELHQPEAEGEGDAALWRAARADLLRQALEKLPPEFREMIVLCDIEGLGYKEIAVVADLPIGTVMSRLSRARGKLRAEALALLKQEALR